MDIDSDKYKIFLMLSGGIGIIFFNLLKKVRFVLIKKELHRYNQFLMNCYINTREVET